MTCSRSRSFTISSSTLLAITGSRPVVGSSKSSRLGFDAIARAIPTRRRWPPESSDGMRSPYSREADELQHLGHARVAPPRADRCAASCSRKPTFSPTVSESNSAFSWNDMPMSLRSCSRSHFRHPVDALAVDGDGARVRPQQAENQLQDDRLAGAARAQQHGHAALRHREADVAQHDVVVEGERHVLEHDRRRVAAGRSAAVAPGPGRGWPRVTACACPRPRRRPSP